LLRLLEYEALSLHLGTLGQALDVGGGRRADYISSLFRGQRLDSINADPVMAPTVTADLEGGLPFGTAAYDTVLSLNTLEHLRNDGFVLREMLRVLRPGGRLLLGVPFLYPVHASPSDYHRHTEHAWEALLVEAGFSPEDIDIHPLSLGSSAAALSLVEMSLPVPLRVAARAVALGFAVLKARRRSGDGGRTVPLGYFVVALKK